MTDKPQRRKTGSRAVLNSSINHLNIAKEAASTAPVKPIFGSVVTLLAMIRVSLLLFCEEIF